MYFTNSKFLYSQNYHIQCTCTNVFLPMTTVSTFTLVCLPCEILVEKKTGHIFVLCWWCVRIYTCISLLRYIHWQYILDCLLIKYQYTMSCNIINLNSSCLRGPRYKKFQETWNLVDISVLFQILQRSQSLTDFCLETFWNEIFWILNWETFKKNFTSVTCIIYCACVLFTEMH